MVQSWQATGHNQAEKKALAQALVDPTFLVGMHMRGCQAEEQKCVISMRYEQAFC